jgi:uncharacterized membrane protein
MNDTAGRAPDGDTPAAPPTAPAQPSAPATDDAAANNGFLVPVATGLPLSAPFQWLAAGARDFAATGFRAAFYGLIFALMGLTIATVYETRWQMTMGLTAGFFLLGPFVCTGVYELSRQRERGEPIDLRATLSCWRRNVGAIGFFAAILTFLMIVWARVSVVLFALASTTEFPTMRSVLSQIVSPTNIEFLLLWGAVGFVFASLVFAISVVSVPLMLDRGSDTMMAIFASARALASNPGPVYLWALLIVAIIGASLLLWFWLLVVTAPLIGHATWHAYRALVKQ